MYFFDLITLVILLFVFLFYKFKNYNNYNNYNINQSKNQFSKTKYIINEENEDYGWFLDFIEN